MYTATDLALDVLIKNRYGNIGQLYSFKSLSKFESFDYFTNS